MGNGHRHRPPLTAAELAEIYDSQPTPQVLRLLWEIHRLRATILRADQIRRMIGPKVGPSYATAGIWELFEKELDAEPCLTDPPTTRQKGLLYPSETQGRMRRRMRNGD
jgi:hypothetical protein